jgi:hypothetical protein
MKRIDIVKKGNQWIAESNKKVVVKGSTKAAVIKNTSAAARGKSRPVNVRIHKANGRIQEERTYLNGGR